MPEARLGGSVRLRTHSHVTSCARMSQISWRTTVAHQSTEDTSYCDALQNLPIHDQGGACGAAGPAPAPGSALGRPARRSRATPQGAKISKASPSGCRCAPGRLASAARLSSSRAAGQGRLGRRTRWLRQPGPAARSQGPWRLRERRTGPGLPCPALGWNQAGPGLLRRDAVPQPVRARRRARLEAQRVGKPFYVGTLGIGVHVVALAELLGQVLGQIANAPGGVQCPRTLPVH